MGVTGKLVGAKAIDQTDGVVTTQCVVIADTPDRSVGIVVTCLDEAQNTIRTGKSYGTAARERIGSLQSSGVVVRGPNAINALVRDVVATKTQDSITERATDTGNAQVRATAISKGTLRDVGELIDDLYEPTLRLKILSQGQLLIKSTSLLGIRGDKSAARIVDSQCGATPCFEQTEIPDEVIIGRPIGAAGLTVGIG